MVDASRRRGMANIIDTKTGLKVDLCVLPSEPFFHSVFARALRNEFLPGGAGFGTVSPEDVILMKLLRRKDSRSQKQWADALSVVRCRGSHWNWAYLKAWADKLGFASDFGALVLEGDL